MNNKPILNALHVLGYLDPTPDGKATLTEKGLSLLTAVVLPVEMKQQQYQQRQTNPVKDFQAHQQEAQRRSQADPLPQDATAALPLNGEGAGDGEKKE